MEKLVIFVIIIIISQIFSKKKKKAQADRHIASTTFYDSKGNKVPRSVATSNKATNSTAQPQSMSEALNELRNIFTNPAQPQPVHKPEPKPVPVYETNVPEMSTESNNAEYSEQGYKEVQSNYDTYMQKNETDRINKANSAFNPKTVEEKDNSYTIKAKKKTLRGDILTNLFNTKNDLKKAIIITEVFNKKY